MNRITPPMHRGGAAFAAALLVSLTACGGDPSADRQAPDVRTATGTQSLPSGPAAGFPAGLSPKNAPPAGKPGTKAMQGPQRAGEASQRQHPALQQPTAGMEQLAQFRCSQRNRNPTRAAAVANMRPTGRQQRVEEACRAQAESKN